jgi:small nuclear ribonucleoprotein G
MDKLLFINIQGNRKVSGYLRGFDIFLNLVLDDAREEGGAEKIPCGTIVRALHPGAWSREELG